MGMNRRLVRKAPKVVWLDGLLYWSTEWKRLLDRIEYRIPIGCVASYLGKGNVPADTLGDTDVKSNNLNFKK